MRKTVKTDADKRKVDAQAPDRNAYAKRFYALANEDPRGSLALRRSVWVV
jgi:hypothetical protein